MSNTYTVESSVFFGHEKESELVNIMKEHGTITGTAGGFPVSPMVYKWEGTDEGIEKIKKLTVKIKSR